MEIFIDGMPTEIRRVLKVGNIDYTDPKAERYVPYERTGSVQIRHKRGSEKLAEKER